MNQIQTQQIMQAAQGLCGIIGLLYQNNIDKEVAQDNPEWPVLDIHIEGHLFTAAKHLAHQLNGDTENLDDYDFVKRESE